MKWRIPHGDPCCAYPLAFAIMLPIAMCFGPCEGDPNAPPEPTLVEEADEAVIDSMQYLRGAWKRSGEEDSE